MQPIRIWYQSYVDEPNGKVYWDRLRRHLATIVDPGTTVDVKGITPHDNYAHAIVEFRCAREVICNAVKAEREGYDAFVMGHFRAPGFMKRARWSTFRSWRSAKRRCFMPVSSASAAVS
jgi:allantoin racemase